MALSSSPLLIFVYLSLFLVGTFSSDMSIISYDKEHGMAARSDDEVRLLYEAWLVEHGKHYGRRETETRFQIFKDNLKYIDEQNALPDRTYELGLNEFADLTNEEYRRTYLGSRVSSSEGEAVIDEYDPKVGVPNSIDWRQTGAIGPIKSQGSCGSCWAFSALAAVEAINQRVTGNYISLSEQQLVDCSSPPNNGCISGAVTWAYDHIISNRGVDTEANYPYTAIQGTCRTHNRVVRINSYRGVQGNNENALKIATASIPAISVLIEAGGKDFQLYSSGIFNGNCGVNLDHGVNIVGYGTERGMDFWIVRNSWGPGWGESGYIRMRRNVASSAGLCGIATNPTYPVK